jgi:uncharacterized surface protein with fasciclin (FAS1) repeats
MMLVLFKVLIMLKSLLSVESLLERSNYFSQRTISGKVSARPVLSKLYEAMQISNLVSFFECSNFCSRYTLFAPNNQAFSEFPHLEWFTNSEYKIHLKQLVLYHAIPGRLMKYDLVHNRQYQTLQGGNLNVTRGSRISLNGKATILTYSSIARNGIIHDLNSVLLPEFAMETVLDVVRQTLHSFFSVLQATGVDKYMNNSRSFTIIAPSDHAFDNLVTKLGKNNVAALRDLVKSYILPDIVLMDDDLQGSTLEYNSLQSSNFTSGKDWIWNKTNILGSNGVVHVIDFPDLINQN